MIYQMDKCETQYGLIRSTTLFGAYAPNHKFNAVIFTPFNGNSITITRHKKGNYHTDATNPARVNGFTFMTKKGITTFDINIRNNTIYVNELAPINNSSPSSVGGYAAINNAGSSSGSGYTAANLENNTNGFKEETQWK